MNGNQVVIRRQMDDMRFDDLTGAIVNPIQVPAEALKGLKPVPLAPQSLSLQAQRLPQLVWFDDIPDPLREALPKRIEYWRRKGVTLLCALVATTASVDAVTRHLQDLFFAPASDDGTVALRRFYDPRVFSHLPWILDRRQMMSVMGPINVWAWPDGSGGWQYHKNDGMFALSRPSVARLNFSQKQKVTLSRLPLINQVSEGLSASAPDFDQDATFFRTVDQLLSEAKEKGIVDDRDCRLYVTQAFQFGPDIHKHPDMEARCIKATSSTISYVEACSDLSDEMLAHYAVEGKREVL
ncbi:DUF4123 domain-containing protein [Alloalcanivorax dieselolei]|nr:DUF4123 domain-containing protein [Alloalcanivorax dieselolei]